MSGRAKSPAGRERSTINNQEGRPGVSEISTLIRELLDGVKQPRPVGRPPMLDDASWHRQELDKFRRQKNISKSAAVVKYAEREGLSERRIWQLLEIARKLDAEQDEENDDEE